MPRNKLLANAFFYAGLIEAWGRGFEIITEEFTSEGLAVPTFKEEFGGVTATIKREIFQTIQLGKKSGGKQGDLDNGPEAYLDKLTDRQATIIRILSNQGQGADQDNDLETMQTLARKLSVSESTVKRELKTLVSLGRVKHFGPDRGGRWMVIMK